ncbi:hypothetical protein SESBI_42667 [Sesbania bispinosa]|nr:hypothetical protein SESBI_42667 [Sesbania bispinosa]
MEDYLLRNKGVFPVPVFEATSWDNTFEKDPGDFPKAERDVSASSLNELGFGIIFMKPLPIPSFAYSRSMFGNRTLDLLLALGLSKTPNPSRLLKKAVANLDGYRSNLKGRLKCSDLNIPRCK